MTLQEAKEILKKKLKDMTVEEKKEYIQAIKLLSSRFTQIN